MPTSRHAPKARRARGARRSKRAPLGRGRARGPAGLRSHALGFGWWPATPSVRGRLFPQRACAVRGFVGLACKPPAKAGGPRQCSANRLASRKDRPADEPGSGAPGRSRHLGWGRAREPSLCNITKRSRPPTSLLRSLQSWRPRPKSLMRPGVWTGRTVPLWSSRNRLSPARQTGRLYPSFLRMGVEGGLENFADGCRNTLGDKQ